MSLKGAQYHQQSEHVVNSVGVTGGNIREWFRVGISGDDVEAFMLRWILGRWQVGSCSRVWNSDSQVGNSSTVWTLVVRRAMSGGKYRRERDTWGGGKIVSDEHVGASIILEFVLT
ncbi:hypothetical protein BDN71DRAFT_161364 [Pleurotus eryngii]|uniref:Uncharacterized protein n=1 Tax=Pleurotus eryngii TaxID=5323 RepID=A0A9P6D4D4_PLEER|nr:hypothetical protein BDN71DRAFT_161364 [Pleurotus eryngii]